MNQNFKRIAAGFVMLLTLTLVSTLATAQVTHTGWLGSDGHYWSNLCLAPSGNWWIYPVPNAQWVGTQCVVPHQGPNGPWMEPGTVVMTLTTPY